MEAEPTTLEIVETINHLWNQLLNEYGGDFSFQIVAQGLTIAATNMTMGIVPPKAKERTEPVETLLERAMRDDGSRRLP